MKRHMKKHLVLSLEDSKQICKDIKSNKDETSMYSEKPKIMIYIQMDWMS